MVAFFFFFFKTFFPKQELVQIKLLRLALEVSFHIATQPVKYKPSMDFQRMNYCDLDLAI